MEFITNEKLTIVGAAGMIGSNMAQTAIMMHLTPNICLYDPYAPGLEGVAEEMFHCGFEGLQFGMPHSFRTGRVASGLPCIHCRPRCCGRVGRDSPHHRLSPYAPHHYLACTEPARHCPSLCRRASYALRRAGFDCLPLGRRHIRRRSSSWQGCRRK